MEEKRYKSAISFEEMEVWRCSRVAVKEIYLVSGKSNFAKDFGLRDQIRRAAVSVMSNIAEGSERSSTKEFIQYLFIAKAYSAEVRSQLYIALDLDYLSQQQFKCTAPTIPLHFETAIWLYKILAAEAMIKLCKPAIFTSFFLLFSLFFHDCLYRRRYIRDS